MAKAKKSPGFSAADAARFVAALQALPAGCVVQKTDFYYNRPPLSPQFN